MSHRTLAVCWTLIALLAAVSAAASSAHFESIGSQADGSSGKSGRTKSKSPPKAKSAPPARAPAPAKADPKALEERVAKMDVRLVFPDGDPRFEGTVERVRTGRGNWWREPEMPPPDEPITAQAIKLELVTPLDVTVSIPAEDEIMHFGVAGTDPPKLPTGAPDGFLGAEVSIIRMSTTTSQFTVEMDGRSGGPASHAREAAIAKTRTRLVANALAKTKLDIVHLDGLVLAVSVVAKEGEFRLKLDGVTRLEECRTLTPATRAALEARSARYAEFTKLKPSSIPASLQCAHAAQWTCTLAAESARDELVFEGCVHCAHRPGDVIPSHVKSECPGCQHKPLCEGGDREGCGGCRKGLETRHYMTTEEARVYRRLQDQAADQAQGAGSFVEVRIRMPCIHQARQRVTRKVLARDWRLGGVVQLTSPDAQISKCMVRVAEGGKWAGALKVRTPTVGACVLSVQFAVEESLPDSDKRERPSAPSPEQLAASAGYPEDPAAMLDRVSFLIEDSTGNRYRAIYDPRSKSLRTKPPTFAEWELLESAGGG